MLAGFPWPACWEMPPRGHFSYKFVRWRALPGPTAGNVSHRYLTSLRHVGISQRYLMLKSRPEKHTRHFFIGAETLCSYEKLHVCFLGLVCRLCDVKSIFLYILFKSGSVFFYGHKKIGARLVGLRKFFMAVKNGMCVSWGFFLVFVR